MYILTGGSFGFVGYYDDDLGKAEIWAGTVWNGGTAQVQLVFDDRKLSVYGSSVFDFDMSSNGTNSVPQEYDPGATYEDPVTGQEYFANSGSETYDNYLANAGLYSNPGDMNYKRSYDVYFGSNYNTGYTPAIDNMFCVFENAEYLSSIFGSGYETNDYINLTRINNPDIDIFNIGPNDYYTIMNSNFKTGNSIDYYSDIYRRINIGQPVSALVPGNPYHAVTIVGYNTTTYELIYMDPQNGFHRFSPSDILKLLGLIPIKQAR